MISILVLVALSEIYRSDLPNLIRCLSKLSQVSNKENCQSDR